MSEQLQCQLEAQKVAHKEELAQLEVERIMRVDEHNSVLGRLKVGFMISATSLASTRTS
jgi:hypothetical protein